MTTLSAQHFDSASFREAIAGTDQPVLVDFYADWCPPCRAISATIDALADKFSGRARVGKIDVDAHKDLAGEFDVQSIPAVLVFLDGKVIDRFTGITPKDTLARSLEAGVSGGAG